MDWWCSVADWWHFDEFLVVSGDLVGVCWSTMAKTMIDDEFWWILMDFDDLDDGQWRKVMIDGEFRWILMIVDGLVDVGWLYTRQARIVSFRRWLIDEGLVDVDNCTRSYHGSEGQPPEQHFLGGQQGPCPMPWCEAAVAPSSQPWSGEPCPTFVSVPSLVPSSVMVWGSSEVGGEVRGFGSARFGSTRFRGRRRTVK